MLNKNFRYVSLDFETTGLDVKKDEAIQIGLVEIDVNGKPIKEFKSFVKPQKDISELRDLVAYITGIKMDDIKDAPSILDLKDEILDFFGENVVLIWHNIEFDIAFMQKYFGEVQYYSTLDTLILAQSFVHFAPSYALDVLVEHLLSKEKFKNTFDKIHGGVAFDSNDVHDALYDSKNSLALFFYLLSYMTELVKEYPVLSNFLAKNTWLYNKILDLQLDRAGKKNNNIELPNLERQLPSNVSIDTDLKIKLEDYQNKERYFIGNVDMKKLIRAISSWNKNVILSFSSVAKLNIVKNILNEIGMKNIWFFRWQTIISKSKFKRFLNKEDFGDNELLFVFKYMSHLRNNSSVLDLNNNFDYKIYHYIQDNNKNKKYPIVLTSHAWLFSILEDVDHLYRHYDVCFFDTEMRYKSYNSYLSKPSDLYLVLNLLENFYYKYTLENLEAAKSAIDSFARFFEVFMWVLFTETKKKFVDIRDNFLTINPILENIDFFETNRLIKKFDNHKKILEETLDQKDFENLRNKIDHMINIFGGLIQVDKRMYTQSEFYFVYSESSQFTNWDEFTDIFLSHTLFFSNFDGSYKNLIEDEKNQEKLKVLKLDTIGTILNFMEKEKDDIWSKTYFIISTVKSESKEIFESLYSNGFGQKSELLVENITWSMGKNIFKAKTKWSKIIVGGYNFLMWLFANKVNIDICIDFNIKWKSYKYLLNDIQRYAKKDL